MGTAGCGDVLAGVVPAMYGLGVDLDDAVRTAVFMHGLAGDIAARRKGADGITADDILNFVPEAINQYRENYRHIVGTYYDCLRVV
jgi:NAD(P)H-hydrate epimerase